MFAKSILTKGGDAIRDEFSVAFDGTNDYLSIPQTTYDIDGGTVSFTFWAALGGDPTATHNIILGGPSGSTINMISLRDNGVLLVESSTEGDTADGTLIAHDTNWHYYAITCNSGTIAMYQDGVALSMNDSSISDNIVISNISHTSSPQAFNGNISEVAIYNSALTVNQVKTIYNGREPYNHKEGVASGNLTSWYRMGDGALDKKNSDTLITNSGIIANEVSSTLGSNLVANGTFDADSDWTKGTGWSIGSGVATATSVSSQELTQDVGAVADKTYKISFDMTSFTEGFLSFNVGGGAESYALLSTGHVYAYQRATNTNDLRFDDGGPGTLTCSIDNVKVKEVTGNPALPVNMGKNDIEGDTP